ncbi:MAG TPA: hypothetical protein VK577_03695 [Bradyrhizobium sp.]|nr:hypothetical protein [Bradyrhizobium sp.]
MANRRDEEKVSEIVGRPKLGSQRRAYANEVADWCARELEEAKGQRQPMGRAYVQNVDLIIAALREYANQPPKSLKGGWVNVYPSPKPPGEELVLNGSFVTIYETREDANRAACSNRFACVQIPDIAEGEGL